MSGGALWGSLMHDLKFALRQLRRQAGFTTVAVVTLALGIGANAAVFSVVNGVLLRPLPYPAPEELVRVWTRFLPESGFEFPAFSLSPWEALRYREDATALRNLTYYRQGSATLTGGEPQRITAVFGDDRLLPTLGVPPLLGRWIDASEDEPRAAQVAVLGHDLWSSRFGADPSVVGRTILVDGVAAEVVGVMPAGFAFPDPSVQLYLPSGIDEEHPGGRSSHGVRAVARLAPGVTLQTAQAELAALNEAWREAYGHPQAGHFLYLVNLHEDLVADADTVLFVLMASVVLVLLIAAVNVANLMLARGETRHGELSLRMALGASLGRIVRQLLTESLLLSGSGAAIGLGLAYAGVTGVRRMDAAAVPRLESVSVDGRVLTFTIVAAVASALVFGLLPAFVAGPRATPGGRTLGPRDDPRPGRRWARRTLVTCEVALSVVVVVSAGLVGRSFISLMAVEPGLAVERRLTFGVSLPDTKYRSPEEVDVFMDGLLGRLRAVPGVASASFASHLPFTGRFHLPSFDIEGRTAEAAGGRNTSARTVQVSAGYLDAMGIRLLRGRSLNEEDRAESEPVALISEEAARLYWPREDPLGQRIRMRAGGDPAWMRIVGVVHDTRDEGLNAPVSPQLYLPATQLHETLLRTPRDGSVILRTTVAPLAVAGAARRALRSMDPDLPMTDVRTMDELLRRSTARPRLASVLLCGFGVIALLLAAVGVYGIVSYTLARRTREIGIRLALGAGGRRVVTLMIREGTTPALLGVGVGVVGALAATSLLHGMLFEVSATDPLTFFGVPLGMLGVALLASWLPSRRAARVAPLETMKAD